MKQVILGKRLDRALREGAPWVFRDALDRPPRLPDGEIVEVALRSGRGVATGFWDATSTIAVRVLEAGPLPDADAEVDRRLTAAIVKRLAKLDLSRTNAFRWVHGEADRLPGIHVDLYDDVAVVRFDGAGPRAFYRNLGPRLAGIRPLRAVVDRDGETLHGTAPEEVVVRENDLRFEVAPGRASKGGLFLDQRENREVVEKLSRDRRVLNLFGYTGGFSLYAARGGASSTDTVDVSRPALAAARRNFTRSDLSLDRAGFHALDAFDFLADSVRAHGRWDLVISDPPSFAPSRKSLPRAHEAYLRLHKLAAGAVAPGGILCAASCSSHFRKADLVESVRRGARMAGRGIEIMEVCGAGFDHPVIKAFPEGDYLKFLVAKVLQG